MSVQFGIWNFDGGPPRAEEIDKGASWLLPYSQNGQTSYSKGGVSITYGAFHTTREARGEIQPVVLGSGDVITWDGRLDNRAELQEQLHNTIPSDCSDVLIVATAYERLGPACFSKLIGDWALSVWNPTKQVLTLARDPIGTRPLFYAVRNAGVIWSSLLEPIVLCKERPVPLDEEYIAGWLSFFPAPELTPYMGIRAVPPSCSVRLASSRQSIQKFWDFDPDRRVTYKTDEEYEEHFRVAFGLAVSRRLRCDTNILAELSGGMDSSAIVCMADALVSRGEAPASRLDTVSYYNDDEPNWDERPYFTKVEQQRGQTGCHILVDSERMFAPVVSAVSFRATPASLCDASPEVEFKKFVDRSRSHVLLSGIGGDEVTGGVPTAIPEIADLLADFQFVNLSKQLRIWALTLRCPWIHIFLQTAQQFLPHWTLGSRSRLPFPPWLDQGFGRRNRHALAGYPLRLKMFHSRPSFQDSLHTLDGLRRQLSCFGSMSSALHEKRYPFLDRDFLEFVYAVPRSQLVRPGQRRSLMRRALASIIPQGILERRRKAFVVRAPLESMAKNSEALFAMTTDMACESGGFVDSPRFAQVLREACRGLEVASVPILRTVQLEQWLKHIIGFGITNLSNFGPEPSQSDISGLVRSRNFEQGKEVKT